MLYATNWKASTMSDTILPLIHKAPVEGIRVHVARAGLMIGDNAAIDRLSDGRIGVFASVKAPVLGIFPRRRTMLIGHLGPLADNIIAPAISQGDGLRVRIIDVTPEHLANGYPPEVYISVWGHPRYLTTLFGVPEAFSRPESSEPQPEKPESGRSMATAQPA